MQDREKQGPRSSYAGRFAGAPERSSARANSGAAARRPTGFAAPEPKRPAPRPQSAARPAGKPSAKPEKPVDNKRGAPKRRAWWKFALAGAAAVVVLTLVLALILGGGRTYHQLPRVTRGSESAYAPEGSAVPGGSPAPTQEADIQALIDAGDYEAAAALIEQGLAAEDGA